MHCFVLTTSLMETRVFRHSFCTLLPKIHVFVYWPNLFATRFKIKCDELHQTTHFCLIPGWIAGCFFLKQKIVGTRIIHTCTSKYFHYRI